MAGKLEQNEYINLIKESEKQEECPVKCTLEIIGGKWKLRVLSQIMRHEVCRFNELKRDIPGITNTMLSSSLRELEYSELIKRTQYNEMPVKVEYSLTELGKSLFPLLHEIDVWWNNYKNYKQTHDLQKNKKV
ncbi:MAG: helix-turn-helix transcriptional regulator [Clostridia bacterium]|nr:helix-turn-helix transcriptional regulator [Clostridia bacterium]MCI1999380.1 helix-turn-helix transcriptional regulator [Clostridia bacterium]MCI2015118.1 helix-turn-helix transcriptional regulator [Clostridia bacterium]